MTTKTTPAAKKAPARKKPPGPRAAVGKTSARVEQMRSEAFAMLVRGLKCPAIGTALGVSRVRAWQLANEGMEALRAETMDQAAQVRLMQTERHMARLTALDAILNALDTKGKDFLYDASARAGAVAKATQIEAEIAKLWGSYMPTKSEVTGANGGPLGGQAPAHNLSALTSDQLAAFHSLAALAAPIAHDPEGPTVS